MLLLVGIVWSSVARADARQSLQRAQQAFNKQDYERTLKLLQPVAVDPQATVSQKIDALELMGLSYLILGDQKRARESFENLLGLDASHQLRDPTESPKLKLFFESVKAAFLPGYDPKRKAQLEHRAPHAATAGRKVEFSAQLTSGAALVRSVVLRWRRDGLLTYRQVTMRVDAGGRRVASFVLPDDTSGYLLEYYIEARSSAGHALARLGAPGHPLSLRVSGAARRVSKGQPFYKRWWFWTLVGTAVVAGTTTAIVLGRERAPTGTLGNVTVGLHALRF